VSDAHDTFWPIRKQLFCLYCVYTFDDCSCDCSDVQAAIEKKYQDEQLPQVLTSLEALLKQNKNGEGFFVGDEVNENIVLYVLPRE